jgi:hypothetical protein
MPRCRYCDQDYESEGELLDHLYECEDRSECLKWSSEYHAKSWYDTHFAKPTTPRVHNILDDVAILFESLYPLPDAVFAAGLVAVEYRPTILISANHRISACTLQIAPGSIQWSLTVGSFSSACVWNVSDKDLAPSALPAEAGDFATKQPYKDRVLQSLRRVYELVTIGDLSTVYTFTEVGDAKLLRDAIKGGDINCVVWQYDWDPHAELKLLYHATRGQLTWCSKYIGVSKLMCTMCHTWYRVYNARTQEGFRYLGGHAHIFKYWKLAVLLPFEPIVIEFEKELHGDGLFWQRKSVQEGSQKFYVYTLKTKGGGKQVRDRSPERGDGSKS